MGVSYLTNARLASGELVDIAVDHSGPRPTIAEIAHTGTISAGPPSPSEPVRADRDIDSNANTCPDASASADGALATDVVLRAGQVSDMRSWLVLPAPTEPHAHLDKAFLAEVAPNPTGDLDGAIQAMQTSAPLRTRAYTAERAERAALRFAANGYHRIRSHVDLTFADGLDSAEALVEVRRKVANIIDIELVGLVGMGFSDGAGGDQLTLLTDGLDMGIDLVGGCPHLETDSRRATDMLLQVATDRRVGVDLHTDETLNPAARGLDQLVDAVEAGFALPVTASHCVALGQRRPDEQRQLATRVAAAHIGVVTLPQTNLFLQGRDQNPVPRALTAIDALTAAGVTVAAGADNIQDPFNPMGRACPFETAALMVIAAYASPEQAWAMVSTSATKVLGRADPGVGDNATLVPGAAANLLAVDALTLQQAIAEAPSRRRIRPCSEGAEC